MSRFTKTKTELVDMSTILSMVQSLEQMSASRIYRLSQSFKDSSLYFEEMQSLYAIVMSISAGSKKNKIGKRELLKVVLTSNRHFYGTLNVDVMTSALKSDARQAGDMLVIGKIGKQLLKQLPHNRPRVVESMIFLKDIPTMSELHNLLKFMSDYKKILFYYPVFKSALRQDIAFIDIEAVPQSIMVEDGKSPPHIFEPEIDELADFFKTTIERLLIIRIFGEADIARTAARLWSMSRAEERGKKQITLKRRILKTEMRLYNDRRYLDSLSGTLQWKKTTELNKKI